MLYRQEGKEIKQLNVSSTVLLNYGSGLLDLGQNWFLTTCSSCQCLPLVRNVTSSSLDYPLGFFSTTVSQSRVLLSWSAPRRRKYRQISTISRGGGGGTADNFFRVLRDDVTLFGEQSPLFQSLPYGNGHLSNDVTHAFVIFWNISPYAQLFRHIRPFSSLPIVGVQVSP